MSTGGLATLLSIQPHPFRGLQTIGTVFYILNLVLFVALCTILSIRFTKYPSTFLASLKHEREGLFFGPFWLSIATIVTGTQRFVVLAFEEETATREWLTTSIAVAFWCYTVCTFLVAVGQYSYLFVGGLKYRVDKFMPSWLLPIFPIMLSGTIAAVIASDQPLPSRYPILFAGLACKGLGFSVCFIFYAHYLGRLMSTGLPNREHRTAMFIAAGPPSFLALAILGMANAIPLEADLFPYSEVTFYSGSVIRTIALMLAIPLWMLALWFFSIAVVAVALSPPKLFHLGWWGMVFPNTGLCIATIKIGEALNVEGFLYAGNVMTVLLVVMWGFTLVMNVRAVVVRDIMYPGMDEDVAD
ncbi:C4-dicarboxylate transporter/malic acid transport protein [Tothia fuscella]|uniref:C4-dicarboxylate transporter/malic acid transport protein n=1 Tax=Tothia fuscella TaxID=1048955 RepID=A0A9P4U0W8_9PEZI|nr:C4-dicarboxylate transporter/malic acid transport protein [Tothia fuscella]